MPEQSVIDDVLSAVDVPQIPRVVAHLTQLLHQPDAGLREVGAAISQDPSLASHVLRIANSVYYGLEEPVLDIQRAAVILGMRTLNEIVWRAAVMSSFDHLAGQQLVLETFWKHSILTGQLGQWLGTRCSTRLDLGPSDLYTCGLLHDLGRLVLLSAHRGRYEEILQIARANYLESAALEVEHFGFTHTQVGAVLAFTWHMPEPLQNAIEYHHGPERLLHTNVTAALVALSDHVAHCVEQDRSAELSADNLLRHPACKLAGLTASVLTELAEQAWQEYRQIEL